MAITRWRPNTSGMTLRDAMQQLVEDAFVGWPSASSTSDIFPVDIHENGDELEIDASIPGARPDEIEVTATNNTVAIRAEIRSHRRDGDGDTLREERYIGVVQRAFTLPTEIDPNGVKATYENGILTVRLPKAEGARQKRVEVRAGSSNGQPKTVNTEARTGDGGSKMSGTESRTMGEQRTGTEHRTGSEQRAGSEAKAGR